MDKIGSVDAYAATRRREYQLPAAITPALIQNTGPMPKAAPTAPNGRVNATYSREPPGALPMTATRSPDRVARWEQVDHYNALARAYCAATPGRTFVDINPALVDANGHPRLDLYVADKLHFHPPAYVAFTAILKPVLARVWAEANGVP